MPTITTPTRTGYTFGGYFAIIQGSSVQYYNANGTSAKNWDLTANTILYALWTANTYTITFNKQSGSGGSDTVTATYDSAMSGILAPTRTGYTFLGYYDSTADDATKYYNANCTSAHIWDKAEDSTLYAKWQINSYRLTAYANDGTIASTTGWTGTGSSSYKDINYGSAYGTLPTVSRTGYTFGGWYTAATGGTQVSTETTIGADAASIYAHWTINTYSLQLASEPLGGGTTSGAGSYNYLTEVEIDASPNPGYIWVNWTLSDNVVSSNQTYTVTVTNNATYIAHFSPATFTVTLNPNGGTKQQGGPDSVNITYGTYDENYPSVKPTPLRTAYDFAGYSDSASGGTLYYNANGVGTRTFDKTSNTTFYAVWSAKNYTATFNPTGGAWSGTSDTGTKTSQYTIESAVSIPSPGTVSRTGYTFTGWVVYSVSNGNWTVGQSLDNEIGHYGTVTFIAQWEPIVYTISASAATAGTGSVSGSGDYAYGTTCTLTATASTGYQFNKWVENHVDKDYPNPYTFIVEGDRTLTASFSKRSYDVTVEQIPEWSGLVQGGGTKSYDAEVEITQSAFTGYVFKKWVSDYSGQSTEYPADDYPELQFNMPARNVNVTAYFNCIVTASADPAIGGTVTGGGEFAPNASCTVVATANVGYSFLGWYSGQTLKSVNASYTFTVTEPITLTAKFAINQALVTTEVVPSDAGTVSGAGAKTFGSSVTLTKTTNTGYAFYRWKANISDENVYTYYNTSSLSFTMPDWEVDVTAYYKCKISLSMNNLEGGEVVLDPESSDSYYESGDSVTARARAAQYYRFVNWTENGEVVSTDDEYTFTVTEPRNLVANFAPTQFIYKWTGTKWQLTIGMQWDGSTWNYIPTYKWDGT